MRLGKIDIATLPLETTPGMTSENKPKHRRIHSLDDCLNIDDIELLATEKMNPRAWAYYSSGGDDLISKKISNTVYRNIFLRPRFLRDCTKLDISTTLLGNRSSVPFFVSPAALAGLAHPDGEQGIARACGGLGAIQIISNNASQTPEEIVSVAREGQIFGWQMHAQQDRRKSENMLARVNQIPLIKFLCLSIDAAVPGKREDDERMKNYKSNVSIKSAVVADPSVHNTATIPQGKVSVSSGLFAGAATDLTWDTALPWLARHTQLPIVLKGIQTHEDAYLAATHAPHVKAIILSNHGGRGLDTGPPAIHTLIEIRKYCPEVLDRIEVWVDGGIRRGTDVVKALCLGAKGVGLGRAPLYGLGAGGESGVAKVLDIMRSETDTAMRLLGVNDVGELNLRHINLRAVERDVYDGGVGYDERSSRL